MALAILLGAGSARAEDRNKCGCYRTGSGTCYCDKKAKCGCPGDCEPKGCEEAREKQMQREIEAETKKAAEAGRRHTPIVGEKSGEKSATGDKGDSAPKGLKNASATEPSAPAKKLTAAQTKQLVKLLDLYFAEKPNARARNIEEVRNELSQTH